MGARAMAEEADGDELRWHFAKPPSSKSACCQPPPSSRAALPPSPPNSAHPKPPPPLGASPLAGAAEPTGLNLYESATCPAQRLHRCGLPSPGAARPGPRGHPTDAVRSSRARASSCSTPSWIGGAPPSPLPSATSGPAAVMLLADVPPSPQARHPSSALVAPLTGAPHRRRKRTDRVDPIWIHTSGHSSMPHRRQATAAAFHGFLLTQEHEEDDDVPPIALGGPRTGQCA
ncbi:vegetative cell wall protein gp1 [Triticum aestivum]|uniref:vegetative cell wall protein gp1 n=1 Tax=Triticum aestivum TaxID=4565 RepID=UPI001D02E292|nr:vegetative cell wall protein gp1-like [Triticum aestivum]